MKRILFLVALVVMLGGCATKPPTRTNNVCAVLDQKDGFFNNWEKAAKKAEARYGIPMPIIMATMNTESGYRHNARPPRTKLFGFIPWKRQSTAYGYSQALNGTWDHYVRATGNRGAKRTNFADAADFIGWYHRESVRRNGVSPNNAYALYLNYYMGHGAYARSGGKASGIGARGAQRTDQMARRYDQQLRACGRR
ncbi:transglycosylase SLT domain-containing protein [Bartonella sp. LJL80]